MCIVEPQEKVVQIAVQPLKFGYEIMPNHLLAGKDGVLRRVPRRMWGRCYSEEAKQAGIEIYETIPSNVTMRSVVL